MKDSGIEWIGEVCIKPDKRNHIKFLYYWISICKPDFLRVSEGGG